jgi:hypothetical protein
MNKKMEEVFGQSIPLYPIEKRNQFVAVLQA